MKFFRALGDKLLLAPVDKDIEVDFAPSGCRVFSLTWDRES